MLRRLAISEDHVASVRKSAPSKGKLMFSKLFQSESYHLICFPLVTFSFPFLFGQAGIFCVKQCSFFVKDYLKILKHIQQQQQQKQNKKNPICTNLSIFAWIFCDFFFPWTFRFPFWITICIVIGIYSDFKLERENYSYVCWWYMLDLQLNKRLVMFQIIYSSKSS